MKLKFNKKKFFISLVAILGAGALTWYGLTKYKRPDSYQIALDNLAEARFYLKTASNEIASIQFYSGMREETYKMDGVATTTKPYAVVSIEPTNEVLASKTEIAGTITINAVPEEIILIKNPYGTNFAIDLEKLIEDTSDIQLSLKIDPETTIDYELTNAMPEGSITWEKALETATKELEKKIIDTQKLEAYIKVLCDKASADSPFWYVTFATTSGETFFVVIDPNGNIIGKTE
ncbi:MAG: hypothetical protein LBH47_00170 [Christensenellaceae bacterium]|jgi:hypothetical protein|nr:hypothetical protein [Christensenellaceae bacterium]